MADRKPIRWAVPLGCESLMGIAAYYLTHEENMRQSFSQPSRYAKRLMPDGTSIEYIMNDVVDCIRITPPQIIQVMEGKKMVWEKLPPLEAGTDNIDFSEMTEDPDVSGGYYCTVSVVNGTDERGNSLSATFSVKAGLDEAGDEYPGWSIEQGIRQLDGTYKVDGKSATLLLGADVDGNCEISASDGKDVIIKEIAVVLTVTKIFTIQISGVRYELINYPTVFSGGDDLAGRHYLWSAPSSYEDWWEGDTYYKVYTYSAQYSDDCGSSWEDYNGTLETTHGNHANANPFSWDIGSKFVGDATGILVSMSVSVEMFADPALDDHSDYVGITNFYGNLDEGIFSEDSPYINHWDMSGYYIQNLPSGYYYFDSNNYLYYFKSWTDELIITHFFHGKENGIDFEQTIVSSVFAFSYYLTSGITGR